MSGVFKNESVQTLKCKDDIVGRNSIFVKMTARMDMIQEPYLVITKHGIVGLLNCEMELHLPSILAKSYNACVKDVLSDTLNTDLVSGAILHERCK